MHGPFGSQTLWSYGMYLLLLWFTCNFRGICIYICQSRSLCLQSFFLQGWRIGTLMGVLDVDGWKVRNCPAVIEKDTRRAVARHRLDIWLRRAWQTSRGPVTSSITGVWNVLCHISGAEEVMRECDVHQTPSIKANSAVSLSRKPGLDLCCDLLQHLQGVPRTYL